MAEDSTILAAQYKLWVVRPWSKKIVDIVAGPTKTWHLITSSKKYNILCTALGAVRDEHEYEIIASSVVMPSDPTLMAIIERFRGALVGGIEGADVDKYIGHWFPPWEDTKMVAMAAQLLLAVDRAPKINLPLPPPEVPPLEPKTIAAIVAPPAPQVDAPDISLEINSSSASEPIRRATIRGIILDRIRRICKCLLYCPRGRQ